MSSSASRERAISARETTLESTHLPSCPGCGEQSWGPARSGTRLRSCRTCGIVLNDRAPSREVEEQLYDHCESVPVQHVDEIARAQWRWLRGLLPERPRVFDVGCGNGAFLGAVAEEGGQAAGLELDPRNVRLCRESGLDVHAGSLFDVGIPGTEWDAITFWDVLDHLDNPTEALQVAFRALHPGGVLVLRGRNGSFHAPMKRTYSRFRGTAKAARLPDLSVVHRWGLGPGDWLRLVRHAGFEQTSLHPGVPTPGDRYGALGPRVVGRALKGAIRTVGAVTASMSLGRVYCFPSVLITARKGSP